MRGSTPTSQTGRFRRSGKQPNRPVKRTPDEKDKTMKHQIYTNADKDAPKAIKDRNDDVVLSMCKVCGGAETELVDHPECPGKPTRYDVGG